MYQERKGFDSMWWLYVKAAETANQIIYRYSTESKDLDGEIIFDKVTEEWGMSRPSAKDKDNNLCCMKADENFRYVVEKGFPERNLVGIG